MTSIIDLCIIGMILFVLSYIAHMLPIHHYYNIVVDLKQKVLADPEVNINYRQNSYKEPRTEIVRSFKIVHDQGGINIITAFDIVLGLFLAYYVLTAIGVRIF